MERYTYKFVWKDNDGIYQTRYLDNSSLINAMNDFEETFKIDILLRNVKVGRVRN